MLFLIFSDLLIPIILILYIKGSINCLQLMALLLLILGMSVIRILFSLPMLNLLKVTIKFMLFPLLTCFLKGTLTVLYCLSARKMSSTLLPISLTDTFLTLALNLFLLLTVVFILSMFSLTQ